MKKTTALLLTAFALSACDRDAPEQAAAPVVDSSRREVVITATLVKPGAAVAGLDIVAIDPGKSITAEYETQKGLIRVTTSCEDLLKLKEDLDAIPAETHISQIAEALKTRPLRDEFYMMDESEGQFDFEEGFERARRMVAVLYYQNAKKLADQIKPACLKP